MKQYMHVIIDNILALHLNLAFIRISTCSFTIQKKKQNVLTCTEYAK